MNGYIEEMMAGQKVVKVFCHEEEGKENSKNSMTDFLTAHIMPTNTLI